MPKLGFLVICRNPDIAGIDDIEKGLPRLYELTDLYLLMLSVAVARGDNDGVAEVELSSFKKSFGKFDPRF